MKKSKSSFRGKVAKNAQRQEAGSNFGHLIMPEGIDSFMPEPTKTGVQLDFMPYEVTDKNHPDKDEEDGIAIVGSLWYRRPYTVHRSVGVNTEAVICLASIGKKCPICEYREKRKKAGAEKEELSALKQVQRNLYVVIPIGSKKYEQKPHIFDISQFLFQKLLNEELRADPDNGVFPELEGGKTLKVRFEEDLFAGNKFYKASRIDFLDREEDYEESILEEIPNLDKMLKILTYDQIEAKFFEIEGEAVVEEEEDRPIRNKSSKKVVEEEEEAPPTRKPSKKVVEEEEEEENLPFKLDWNDISKMKDSELRKLIKSEKLDIDPDDYEDDLKAFRKAIWKPIKIKGIPKEKRCIACGGSGESSKGGICVPCQGTGIKQKSKPIVDEEEEDDEPTPIRNKKGESKDKCPYDHKFGVDTDKFDDCDSCDLWDECMAQKEKNKKKN